MDCGGAFASFGRINTPRSSLRPGDSPCANELIRIFELSVSLGCPRLGVNQMRARLPPLFRDTSRCQPSLRSHGWLSRGWWSWRIRTMGDGIAVNISVGARDADDEREGSGLDDAG